MTAWIARVEARPGSGTRPHDRQASSRAGTRRAGPDIRSGGWIGGRRAGGQVVHRRSVPRDWDSRGDAPDLGAPVRVSGSGPEALRAPVKFVWCVSRLRRIAEALARGHRAGDVVPASDAGVIALLEGTTDTPIVSRAAPAPDLETHDLLRAVQAFDGDRLMRTLFADSARLGPLDFLRTRIVPLIHAVGEAWATKRMDIQHERFVSERISDLLRTLRLPLEGRAVGGSSSWPHCPGSPHSLGLQMAALLLASVGCRILYLGSEVPLPQLAAVARERHARVVALSVSAASPAPRAAMQIARLRARLPRRVALVVGGDGAPAGRPGVEVVQDLTALEAWGRRLAAPREDAHRRPSGDARGAGATERGSLRSRPGFGA